MPTNLIAGHVWRDISRAIRANKGPGYAAVAYFGQGAAKQLPLRKGSWLVVNASEAAVRAGQTSPAELIKLAKRGVRVFTLSNLHAKIFVAGPVAFVGSANVSKRSADVLLEAVIATTAPQLVKSARDYVRSECLDELGLEELNRRKRWYVPPRLPGGLRRRSERRASPRRELERVMLAQLRERDPPAGSEDVQEQGERRARRKMSAPRRHDLSDFYWSGTCVYRPGDTVIEVLQGRGGRRMVSRPGKVVHLQEWRRGKRKVTFVFVESPGRRGVEAGRLAKRIGYGGKKALARNGRIPRAMAERLLAALA